MMDHRRADRGVRDALGGGRTIPYGEKTVNFTPPFQRAKYGDLFREHVG